MTRYILLGLLAALPAFAVQPGDSLEQVLAEKGNPLSRADAGTAVILNYRDFSIQLRDDKVVAIKTKAQAQGPITHAIGPSTPAPVVKTTPAMHSAAANSNEERGEWVTDVRAAIAQARDQNKRLFLFFTGSDWCGWCQRLNREILSTDVFQQYADSKLVLVKIDFPRNIPQPDELKSQNAALAQHYGIRGFPTVIVVDSSGNTLGQLGYQEGGPGPFVQALQKL